MRYWALLLAACAVPPLANDAPTIGVQGDAVKAADRKIIGDAAPYTPVPRTADTREWAWHIAQEIVEDVPLVDLPGTVPRFSTWYARDDIERVFKRLYARDRDFDERAIDEALAWNPRAVDDLATWPEDRYQAYLRTFDTPQKVTGAAGIPRILYSPAFVRAFLARYRSQLSCDHTEPWGEPIVAADTVHAVRDSGFISEYGKPVYAVQTAGVYDYVAGEAAPAAPCIGGELPAETVVVKAEWRRAELGQKLPVFVHNSERTEWSDPDHDADPDATRIHSVTLPNGNVFRLAGLHVMVKALHHWLWITLYWSEQGNDRLPGVWRNYEMCVVDSYENADGSPTMCSNPYIEKGPGNARTNCIGCHQHAGADASDLLSPVRARNAFPTDYVWSIRAGEKLSDIVKTEVAYWD